MYCTCTGAVHTCTLELMSTSWCCRERAEDRYVAAMREELSYHHQRKGEKKRQVERLKLTRDQEGRRARETATRAPHHQPPIIMVCVYKYGHVS